MKIYSKPKPEHLHEILNAHPHITMKKDGCYIIRCTHQKKVYYFGSYMKLEDALRINYILSKQCYPIKYSQRVLGGRGQTYKEKLRKVLMIK